MASMMSCLQHSRGQRVKIVHHTQSHLGYYSAVCLPRGLTAFNQVWHSRGVPWAHLDFSSSSACFFIALLTLSNFLVTSLIGGNSHFSRSSLVRGMNTQACTAVLLYINGQIVHWALSMGLKHYSPLIEISLVTTITGPHTNLEDFQQVRVEHRSFVGNPNRTVDRV